MFVQYYSLAPNSLMVVIVPETLLQKILSLGVGC